MKVPTGGPATINGIFYQILWCLTECSKMRLVGGDADTRKIKSATLILEPPSGGDALVQFGGIQRVVQLKSRTTGRPWTLRQIINDVLPDLYKAVQFGIPQQFEFVTDGRIGDASRAFECLTSLKRVSSDGRRGEWHQMDDSQIVYRHQKITYTQKQLVEEIGSVLQSQFSPLDLDDHHKKLIKLLSEIKFTSELHENDLLEHLRQRLLPFVNKVESVDATIMAMVGEIAIQARKGNVEIKSEVFFDKFRINSIPLSAHTALVSQSKKHLDQSVRALGYDKSSDVRGFKFQQSVKAWQGGHPPGPMLVYGASGQGKTWQLCALAYELVNSCPVILISSFGDSYKDVAEIERKFANIWGQDEPIALLRIEERLKRVAPEHNGPWLYILIDNITNRDELFRLSTSLGELSNVRMACTVRESIAEQVSAIAPVVYAKNKVDDLSDAEAVRLIANNDLEIWGLIPLDVRELLRKPLLAGMYRFLDLECWTDVTEYVLLDLFYNARYLSKISLERPILNARLSDLLMSTWNGDMYPWSPQQICDAGLTDEDLAYLQALGWLRSDADGQWCIWHDRLLAWQIAQTLVYQLKLSKVKASEMGVKCGNDLFPGFAQFGNKNRIATIGYVAMDCVWLMSNCPSCQVHLQEFILGLEASDYLRIEELYEHLLPTVGPGLVPALLKRLESVSEGDPHAIGPKIAEAITRLKGANVAEAAIALLWSSIPELRKAGTRMLTLAPSSEALEPLMLLYMRTIEAEALLLESGDQKSQALFWEQLDVWRAFMRCAALGSPWIESASTTCTTPEYADMLCASFLQIPDGRDVWLRCKDVLRMTISDDGKRHFANSAGFYLDRSELQWLKGLITSPQIGVAASAFRAIIRIDAEAAIGLFKEFPARELYVSRNWTLAPIMARHPEKVKLLISRFISEDAGHLWDYADSFWDLHHELPPIALDALLANLEQECGLVSIQALWRQFKFLERLHAFHQLQLLWSKAGSSLEVALTSLLMKEHKTERGEHRTVWSYAFSVLEGFGGSGAEEVMLHSLERGGSLSRWQMLLAYQGKSELLKQYVREAAVREGPIGDFRESDHAAWALALSGEWSYVVEHILCAEKLQLDILFSRWGEEPLRDAALEVCVSAWRRDRNNGRALIAVGFVGAVNNSDEIGSLLRNNDGALNHSCVLALHLMPYISEAAIDALGEFVRTASGNARAIQTLLNQESGARLNHLISYSKDRVSEARSGGRFEDGLIVADVVMHLNQSEELTGTASELFDEWVALAAAGNRVAESIFWRFCEYAPNQSCRALLARTGSLDMIEKAVMSGSSQVNRNEYKTSAALALSFFNPKWSYSTFSLDLKASKDAKVSVIEAMLRIDEARAVTDVLDLVSARKDKKLALAAAVALKKRGVVKPLLDQLAEGRPGLRSAACQMLSCSFPTTDVFSAVRSLLDDPSEDVYKAACATLHSLGRSLRVAELTDAYKSEGDILRKWLILKSILSLADTHEFSLLKVDEGTSSEIGEHWIKRLTRGESSAVRRFIVRECANRPRVSVFDDWEDED